MATFVPISYTYVPTPPRSKSTATRYKPAPKQLSILNKLQHSKLSEVALSKARLAAADNSRRDRLGIRETSTVYDGIDNDCDLPSIEQLLYTTLRKEGFTMEDQCPKNPAFEVDDTTVERDGSCDDDNGSALGDNSGGSLEDPIVLLGGNDSNAFEVEMDDNSPHAERVAADEDLLDNPETAVNSTTPVPPLSLNQWHDIDDFLKTPRLQLAEQEPSTSHPTPPRTSSSSRASSEPLHNHIGTAASQCAVHARSEATMCSPISPCSEPLDHLSMNRSADEHELVRPALNPDIFDGEESQRQEEEEQEDWGYDNDNDVAATLMSEKVGDTHLSSKEDESLTLANHDPSPEPSQDKLGSDSCSFSDDELNSNPVLINVDRGPRPAKRKRSSSSNNPIYKKPKRHLKQRSTLQCRPDAKLRQHPLKSYSPLDHSSRVTAVSSAKGRLPSPAPSTPQSIDTEIPSDWHNLGRSSSDTLPTLTEVTFRPHSTRCCSFTAVVRDGRDGRGVSFGQLAQLIESIGHVGKIDDFTIKPIEQHSFLLTGFSRHTSSRLSSGTILSPTVEANCVFDSAPSTTLQHSKADDAGALPPEESEPSSSDNDSGLSDSDSDLSSDDDTCPKKKMRGSSTRMNIPWESLDEQRLLAYKKEEMPWGWIFKKFPGRTPAAVRTRWTMVRPRGD